MSSNQLLRILCIHGYRQNEQSFRERTGAFRKLLKKYAELVYITAQNVVPSLESSESEENTSDTSSKKDDQRGWWFSRSDNYFNAQDKTDCCKGYEESLDVIKKAFISQGPFDGVLGFSQGAAMVSLLCGLQELDPESCPKIGFAIMVASFKSQSLPHAKLYEKKVKIPTLHVFGDTDKVIPKEMSVELLEHYENPVILEHQGGHFIPASAPQKKVYIEFLQKMIENKT